MIIRGDDMKRVLIVDDATVTRIMLKDILANNGYDVIGEARDGDEAVNMYKLYSPDIVTMDITMPETNGIEALQQIKEINPNAKVIICSALGQSALVSKAIKLGAIDFILKPFKEDRVLQSVSRVQ